MSDNSRFTVAIHILTLLAYCDPNRITSEYIAGSVNTNPVVIRRILGLLRNKGIVTSIGGPGGGWVLEMPAKKITLKDVYKVIDNNNTFFQMHPNTPNHLCDVGDKIEDVLEKYFNEAQKTLEKKLNNTTIEDLVTAIKKEIA